MADTVTTGSTNGASYTWASASMTWDSSTAGVKTWAGAVLVDYTAGVAVDLALAEGAAKSPSKAVAEALAFAETDARTPGLNIARALAFAEVYADTASFTRQFDEALAVDDLATHALSKAIAEALAIAEARVASFGKAIDEDLLLAEVMGRVADFSRAFDEAIAASDAVAKTVTLPRSENLGVSDVLRRTADAVVSDILIGATDITDAQFQQLLEYAQPVGYGPFRNFLEGDHEYEKAIFKAAVIAMAGSRPRLEALQVAVDVPDLFDSGTVVTSAAGLVTVNFNREFYALPEVTVTLKGGTVFGVPRVHNITLTSFDVELVDAASARIVGTVSWAAKGY